MLNLGDFCFQDFLGSNIFSTFAISNLKCTDMNKVIYVIAFLFVSVFCNAANNVTPNGKYVTEDFNTKSIDGMIKVTYTFTNDSLYIDAYPSGCGITAMKLEVDSNNEYKATETLYDIVSGDVIHKKIYHLSFLKCLWDKNIMAVYRDGVIVDIIKLLEK